MGFPKTNLVVLGRGEAMLSKGEWLGFVFHYIIYDYYVEEKGGIILSQWVDMDQKRGYIGILTVELMIILMKKMERLCWTKG